MASRIGGIFRGFSANRCSRTSRGGLFGRRRSSGSCSNNSRGRFTRRFGRPNLLRRRSNRNTNYNRNYANNYYRNNNNNNNNNRVINNNNNNLKATYNVPENLPNQLKSWRQSNEGNCSAVAVIKSAVDRFDDKVFKSVDKTADGRGYNIEMRDGYKLALSQGELNQATASSRFKTISTNNGMSAEDKKAGLDFANLAYAAMAKRAALTHQGGVRSFQGALHDFENGYDPRNSAKLIGLKDYVQRVNTSNLSNQDSITAWSSRHAIFIDKQQNGSYLEDNWGRAVRYDRNASGPIIQAFTFAADEPKSPAQ